MPTMYRLTEGTPAPLGASWDGRGVNFALFSAHATRVELCLFEPGGDREHERIELPACTDQVWHGYLDGLLPGQLYGYRVHGPYDPVNGHRFNPHKLLIDPYATGLAGRLRWHDALYGYRIGAQRGDRAMDRRDSARFMPKCVVTDPSHVWGGDRPPRQPWRDTIVYEAHVKGLTALHPEIPAAARGSYAALGHPAVVEHLVRLGVTAIELLPVQAFCDDRFLIEKGLVNYWGYQPLAYFAPEPRYLGAYGVPGLKRAIRALHDAGIEVFLDVVYNHTCESDQFGPTLSFRGIDNASYYRLPADNPRASWDVTGTGNSLNLAHPRVAQMALDSLRHWVQVYHVDGFRFDLATTLGRGSDGEFDERSAFLQAATQDPALSGIKLIAEPWDVGPGGYRLGGFPPGWGEWNDQFRDTVRAFWRGDEMQVPGLARVMAGCREIFEPRGRGPAASVNYVASHDGFTLDDLVSYERKHNFANGEGNRDGQDHNLSSSYGVEGPTTDLAILALRARQKRNLLATALLSIGTPMILMGDELSRTQGGNNNAYCQDNEMSWLDWHAGREADPALPDFVSNLLALRHRHDALRRVKFLTGRTSGRGGPRDVVWLAPEGREMTAADWHAGDRRALGMLLGDDAAGGRLLIVMNAGTEAVDFALPADAAGAGWLRVFDTVEPAGVVAGGAGFETRARGTIASRSLAVFRDAGGADTA